MSGTGASLIQSAAGIVLPVPHITLGGLLNSGPLQLHNPAGVDFTRLHDGTKMALAKCPVFTALEVPEAALAFDLRLELLWFRKERRKAHGGGANGYRHPTHGIPSDAGLASPTGGSPVAPVLPVSRFRGGDPANLGPRVSEWSVTKVGQRFFIDTLGLYFVRTAVSYMTTAGGGAGNTTNLFVPSFIRASGLSADPRGFGYASMYRPNYFKFRYSIQDPNDERARLTGPTSGTIVCAHAVHPFVQNAAATAANGYTSLEIDTGFNPDQANCWFETRLPG